MSFTPVTALRIAILDSLLGRMCVINNRDRAPALLTGYELNNPDDGNHIVFDWEDRVQIYPENVLTYIPAPTWERMTANDAALQDRYGVQYKVIGWHCDTEKDACPSFLKENPEWRVRDLSRFIFLHCIATDQQSQCYIKSLIDPTSCHFLDQYRLSDFPITSSKDHANSTPAALGFNT